MSRSRIVLAMLAVMLGVAILLARNAVHAQSSTRAETGDAAVSALVAEVRALRADLSAASRSQLRAQMLLGRVQMQEQRLAYLDKQRSDAAAQTAMLAQMTSAMGNQVQGFGAGGCGNMPSAEARRDCELQGAMLRRQLEEQEKRAEQLRAHERDLENALSTEQARWSEFNSQLDELERALR
jgi:hypothetical protein